MCECGCFLGLIVFAKSISRNNPISVNCENYFLFLYFFLTLFSTCGHVPAVAGGIVGSVIGFFLCFCKTPE